AVAFDRRRVLEKIPGQRIAVEEPRQTLLRRAAFGVHEALVPDEAHARLAVLQRNEPDPVAPAGEMVRREAPRGEDGAGEGARRVRAGDLDAVHVLDAVVADPDRRGRMRLDRGHAAALAGEERLAARRVDGPAAADVHLRAIGFLDRDRVSPGAVAAEREG